MELIRPVAADRFCAKEGDGFNSVGRGRRNRKRQGSWRQPSIDCQPGQPTNLTRTSEPLFFEAVPSFVYAMSCFLPAPSLLFLLFLLSEISLTWITTLKNGE